MDIASCVGKGMRDHRMAEACMAGDFVGFEGGSVVRNGVSLRAPLHFFSGV